MHLSNCWNPLRAVSPLRVERQSHGLITRRIGEPWILRIPLAAKLLSSKEYGEGSTTSALALRPQVGSVSFKSKWETPHCESKGEDIVSTSGENPEQPSGEYHKRGGYRLTTCTEDIDRQHLP